MATLNPTESTTQIEAQNANSDASQTGGGGASQGTPEQSPAWKDLVKRVENAERFAQSQHDKSVAAENKQAKKTYLDEIAPQVEQAAKFAGWDAVQTENYRQHLLGQEMQRRVLGSNDPAPVAPASQGSEEDSAVEFGGVAIGLLAGFGLQSSDPEVSQALLSNSGDVAKTTSALMAIRDKRINQPAPNPAGIGIPTGGSIPNADVDYLYGELAELSKNYTANKPQIESMKTKLRAAGETIN